MNDFVGTNPGVVGLRGSLRGPHFFDTDMAASKTFTLPWENIRLSFRAEAFNVFNNVEWGNPSLSLANPTQFGEITRLCYRRGSSRDAVRSARGVLIFAS